MPLPDLRVQARRRSPDELLAHLNAFELDLRFSAGIWFFTPPFSRFHAKYQPDLDIEARLEIAAGLADDGLVALEAHYPNEVNEDQRGERGQRRPLEGVHAGHRHPFADRHPAALLGRAVRVGLAVEPDRRAPAGGDPADDAGPRAQP